MSSCANLNLLPTPVMVGGNWSLQSISYQPAGSLLVGNSGDFILANNGDNLAFA